MNRTKKGLFRLVSSLLILALSFSIMAGCEKRAESVENAKEPEPTAEVNEPEINEPEVNEPEVNELEMNGVKYLNPAVSNPFADTEPVSEEFASNITDKAFEILRKCEAEKRDNTMVSSLSILTAFAMLVNGADGETQKQILDLFGAKDVDTVNKQMQAVYASFVNTDNAFLNCANSLWMTSDPTVHVKEQFINDVTAAYDAELAIVDFADGARAAKLINGWCDEKTDGMIDHLIDATDVSEDTIMALLNALCFESKWANKYSEEDIAEDQYFYGNKEISEVTMLNSTEYSYIEGKNEIGMIKNYEGGNYAFVALLPKSDTTDIASYMKTLDGKTFRKLIGDVRKEKTVVKLPEFSSEYTVILNNIIKEMGAADGFDPTAANFSKMFSFDDPFANAYINFVIHKTFIQVDADGTKAAAVTGIFMNKCTSVAAPEIVNYVTLDRPFVYAIIDTHTGIPVFLGTCENIQK